MKAIRYLLILDVTLISSFALPDLASQSRQRFLSRFSNTTDQLRSGASLRTAGVTRIQTDTRISVTSSPIRRHKDLEYIIPKANSQPCNIYGPMCQSGTITVGVNSNGKVASNTSTTLPCSSYLAKQAKFVALDVFSMADPTGYSQQSVWHEGFGRSPECHSYVSAGLHNEPVTFSGCPEHRSSAAFEGHSNWYLPELPTLHSPLPPWNIHNETGRYGEDDKCCGECTISVDRVILTYFPDINANQTCPEKKHVMERGLEERDRPSGKLYYPGGTGAFITNETISNRVNITTTKVMPATTTVISSHTLTSPSVMIQVVGTMAVYDNCGKLEGEEKDPFFSFHPDNISTYVFAPLSPGATNLGLATTGRPDQFLRRQLTLSDLACPTPGALFIPNIDPGNTLPLNFAFASEGLPVIAPPSEVLTINQRWQRACTGIRYDGRPDIVGMIDPPRAVQSVVVMGAGPSGGDLDQNNPLRQEQTDHGNGKPLDTAQALVPGDLSRINGMPISSTSNEAATISPTPDPGQAIGPQRPASTAMPRKSFSNNIMNPDELRDHRQEPKAEAIALIGRPLDKASAPLPRAGNLVNIGNTGINSGLADRPEGSAEATASTGADPRPGPVPEVPGGSPSNDQGSSEEANAASFGHKPPQESAGAMFESDVSAANPRLTGEEHSQSSDITEQGGGKGASEAPISPGSGNRAIEGKKSADGQAAANKRLDLYSKSTSQVASGASTEVWDGANAGSSNKDDTASGIPSQQHAGRESELSQSSTDKEANAIAGVNAAVGWVGKEDPASYQSSNSKVIPQDSSAVDPQDHKQNPPENTGEAVGLGSQEQGWSSAGRPSSESVAGEHTQQNSEEFRGFLPPNQASTPQNAQHDDVLGLVDTSNDAISGGYGPSTLESFGPQPDNSENVTSPTVHEQAVSIKEFSAGGQTFKPNPTGFVVAGTQIRPGGPAATVSGTAISLDTAGVLALGSSHLKLTTQTPINAPQTVDGQTFQPAATGFAIENQSIRPGSNLITISGTRIWLDTQGRLTIGTSIIQLATPNPALTVGGRVLAPAATGFDYGGAKVLPGHAHVVVAGTTISLDGKGVLWVGNSSTALQQPTVVGLPIPETVVTTSTTSSLAPDVIVTERMNVSGDSEGGASSDTENGSRPAVSATESSVGTSVSFFASKRGLKIIVIAVFLVVIGVDIQL